jgi:hypothetical protein
MESWGGTVFCSDPDTNTATTGPFGESEASLIIHLGTAILQLRRSEELSMSVPDVGMKW